MIVFEGLTNNRKHQALLHRFGTCGSDRYGFDFDSRKGFDLPKCCCLGWCWRRVWRWLTACFEAHGSENKNRMLFFFKMVARDFFALTLCGSINVFIRPNQTIEVNDKIHVTLELLRFVPCMRVRCNLTEIRRFQFSHAFVIEDDKQFGLVKLMNSSSWKKHWRI